MCWEKKVFFYYVNIGLSTTNISGRGRGNEEGCILGTENCKSN
jgi:hypothetical protein